MKCLSTSLTTMKQVRKKVFECLSGQVTGSAQTNDGQDPCWNFRRGTDPGSSDKA